MNETLMPEDRPSRKKSPPVSAYMTFEEAREAKGVALSAIYAAAKRGAIQTEEVLGKTVLVRTSVFRWEPRRNSRRGKQPGN